MKICHDCPSIGACRWLGSRGLARPCPAPVPDGPASGRQPIPPQVRSRMSLLEAAELTLSHWDRLGERAFDAALDVLERKVQDTRDDAPLQDAAADVLLTWESHDRPKLDEALTRLRALVAERAPTAARHGFTPTA